MGYTVVDRNSKPEGESKGAGPKNHLWALEGLCWEKVNRN